MPTTLFIRPATTEDATGISRICVQTANAGTSAEHLHSPGACQELPGLVYAVPYVHTRAHTVAFVLVARDAAPDGKSGQVVGYVLGSIDTVAYEEEVERSWWPAQRARFPADGKGTESDEYYFKLLAKPNRTGKEVTDVCPAHLHINILPEHQKKGWGRRMIQHFSEEVKRRGGNGMWVGIDSRNDEGRKFYKKIGFESLPSKEGEYFLLMF